MDTGKTMKEVGWVYRKSFQDDQDTWTCKKMNCQMNTLVTGGAGLIGSHIVDALVDEGNHVVVLDGLSSARARALDDCVSAIMTAYESAENPVSIYNVGSEDQTDVVEIARMVIAEMGLKNVKLKFSGGVEGGRGWIGDVKSMLLDISKLKSLGWKPNLNSRQAVRKTVQRLAPELKSTQFMLHT